MSNDRFAVGIIGLGRIGGVHLDAWRTVPGAQVTAVCDASPEARQKAAAEGMAAFDNPAELLERTKLDAVSICAPPDKHLSLSQICFDAGVPVLCEKPLADSLASARALAVDAERRQAVYQMATKFRHTADVRTARELLKQGAIGDPMTFHVEFSGPVNMADRWNSNPSVSGGGVLIDNGSHAIDMVRFLFSRISRVMAVSLKPVQKLAVEDSALILLSTDCGVTGKIMLSWSLKPSADNYLIIQGTKGQIEVGWKESLLRLDGKPAEKIGTGYDKNACHTRMMTMFRDMARAGGPSWITGEECLASAIVTDAAYRSMEQERWVDVDPAPASLLRRGMETETALSSAAPRLRMAVGGR